MRRILVSILGIALSATTARSAVAEDAALGRDSPGTSAPESGSETVAEHLARQDRALLELRAAVEAERRARTEPLLRWSGFLQIDWVLSHQLSQDEIDFSTGEPLNQNRFTLRRGHLRASTERGMFNGALELDLNTVQGPEVRPIDAELGVRWPAPPEEGAFRLGLNLGLLRIPFGFEVQEPDFERAFLERSNVARALFPGAFDLGAKLSGGFRFLDWSLAILNGSPIGNKLFPALAPTGQKEMLGRLGASAEVVPRMHLAAGISAETGTGFHEGTPTTKDRLFWRDENGDGIVQATEVEVVAGSSATPSQTFRTFAIGADAHVRFRFPLLGELRLSAEIVRATNLDRGIEYADPVAAGHDLRELGWYLGATQEITPWAVVGVRYDTYNPDQDASEQRAANLTAVNRTYSTVAIMAMARYQQTRLVIEYDRNGNALGRDASGAPITRQSDVVTLRGQMVF